MGVTIRQNSGEFFIAADKKQEALKAARPVHGRWVKQGEGAACRVLEELFELWGYDASADDDGNITAIESAQEKLGAEFEMFKVIAPFVRAGSFLEMTSDHGGPWRWVFDGVTCKEVQAKVEW